jgi:hypothetical protein
MGHVEVASLAAAQPLFDHLLGADLHEGVGAAAEVRAVGDELEAGDEDSLLR